MKASFIFYSKDWDIYRTTDLSLHNPQSEIVRMYFQLLTNKLDDLKKNNERKFHQILV